MGGAWRKGVDSQSFRVVWCAWLIFRGHSADGVNMDTAFTPHDERSQWSQMFLRDMPQGLLIDLPRMIRQAGRDALRADDGLLAGARRDKYPLDRRARVQTGLYGLAAKYEADGVRAVERLNTGDNYHHTELMAGSTVLIAVAEETPLAIPREASYRRSLAASPQAAFAGFGIESPPMGDALLAVILYGPRSFYRESYGEAPESFAVVKFPVHNWKSYVDGRIDLLARLRAFESQRRSPETQAEEEAE